MELFVPNGNDEQMAKIAKQYDIDKFVMLKGISKHIKNADGSGIILKKYSLSDVMKAKAKADIVVVKANDDIRQVMERVKRIWVYGLEEDSRMDFIHHRNSGLNHILVKIAKKNNIRFAFNFSDFLRLSNYRKAIILGRVRQNLMLCNKFRQEYQFQSFAANPYEIKRDLSMFRRLLISSKAD